MFISDYLSRLFANHTETDSIPFLTSRKHLKIKHDISDACYTIADQPDSREDHCFPLTCLQARTQNITLPGLFSAGGGAAKSKSKTPFPVTHCTAASALTGRPANLSSGSRITPDVHPATKYKGRPHTSDAQIVVPDHDDLHTTMHA